MKITRKEALNPPNLLCYLRLLLVPVFAVCYLTARTQAQYYLCGGIILLCGLTDFLDGQIARRCGMVTELGKLIDPLADKLLQAAIVICLAFRIKGMVFLLALFAVKELYMGINDLLLLRKGAKLDGAMWFGKLSTAVFYVAMFVMIASPVQNRVLHVTLMLVSGFFLALSFVLYIPVFHRMHRKADAKKKDSAA